ncbi:hypothetical protein [Streptomyces sp. 2133.1]|uniref:hypothetical protein n=1 Tax=Streptomyces sp. 2133.1 TaxID=1881021 RepID=UPI0008975E8A|nr:hypothetical protein [Streptomyces sp. 2133.1]SED08995.1 hypothetical protein SAMN05428940_3775 [Streptomyces sp. 2133.1]
MTVSDFSSALHAAFEAPDPRDAVDRIKSVVAEELAQTDSRADVKKTEFFNHSFAPDLVLSWPGEDERFVFLKSDTRPEVLRDDVKAIRKHHPIVFVLDDVNNDPLFCGGAGMAQQDDTLVADTRGMEVLIHSRRNDPVVGLASSAVLQGGRGLLTEAEAEAMASSVASGFNGAQRLDTGATGAAVTQISGHFDSRRTSRLLRFLTAVWVGSGGTPSNFPGEHNVSGDLDSTALEFLLDLPPIDDNGFWRRIGRSLALESIAQLQLDRDTENLQYLVASNLDVLHARACRILERQPELGESGEQVFRWAIDRKMLCLRNDRNAAYFAGKMDDLHIEPDVNDGISLQELLRRVESQRVPISELELATPTRTVSYATVHRDDVSHDDELMDLTRTFSSSAHVKSAVATVMGSRPLVCDFPTRTGKGRTASKFPLGVLAPVAISLLMEVSRTEQECLEEITRYYRPAVSRQEDLFALEYVEGPAIPGALPSALRPEIEGGEQADPPSS